MLTHPRVWEAIDALAERYGLSTSGLAKKAGLDATSFNKSKRVGPDGRDRWPSTESVSKVLRATGASLDEFVRLIEPLEESARFTIPLVGLTQAGTGRLFSDDGLPDGGPGWDAIEFPDMEFEGVFALEVQGDSMLPLYRDGDLVIVSRLAPLRKGDRIVLRTREGEVMAKELLRRSARSFELRSINRDHEDRTIAITDVEWVGRILWARQ